MTIAETIVRARINPGMLAGITLREWLSLLADNRLRIARRYWLRAATISMTSTVNSLVGFLEQMIYRRRWESIEVRRPVIVLGNARSGTTHLHRLLAADPRFGYLTLFQGRLPRVFFLTERLLWPFLSMCVLPRRVQDNVAMQLDSPAEDEEALCALTQLTPGLRRVFSHRAAEYERFATCKGYSSAEGEQWSAAFRTLLQKLTLRYGKPLVTKSPGHAARLPMVLKVVPDARFIFIHRDPGDVLLSARHMEHSGKGISALQLPRHRADHEIVSNHCCAMNCYLEHRSLIPAGHLIEVSYDHLVRDPIENLQRIYKKLALPDFSECEPPIRAYLSSISEFRRNEHKESASSMREQAATECPRWFDEWGYPLCHSTRTSSSQ